MTAKPSHSHDAQASEGGTHVDEARLLPRSTDTQTRQTWTEFSHKSPRRLRQRCAARTGRSFGNACGRRWRHSPGSDCGSGRRRSAARRRCSPSPSSPWRPPFPSSLYACPRFPTGCAGLDHGSGLRHRPATAIVDALAVTPSNSYSLALWNAHVERTRAAAQAFKAGWPSPRVPGATLRTARAREPRPPVKHLIHGERKQLILPA